MGQSLVQEALEEISLKAIKWLQLLLSMAGVLF